MTNPTKKEKLAGQDWEKALKRFEELCGKTDIHYLNIITTSGKTIVAELAESVFKPLLVSQAQKVREELLEQVETASWIQYPPDKTKFVSLAEIKKIIKQCQKIKSKGRKK